MTHIQRCISKGAEHSIDPVRSYKLNHVKR